MYGDRYVQMLEGLTLGNLVFCSSGMIYANLENNQAWKSAVTCISVGIAFLQFLGIVIHCIIRHCVQNFRQQTPIQAAACAVASIYINSVEQGSSSQEHFLSFSDWYETANGDDGDDALESEPLLANNTAPPLET